MSQKPAALSAGGIEPSRVEEQIGLMGKRLGLYGAVDCRGALARMDAHMTEIHTEGILHLFPRLRGKGTPLRLRRRKTVLDAADMRSGRSACLPLRAYLGS